MKFLEVTFRQPDRMLHPMQELIRHENVVVYDELRAWNLMPGRDVEYELFYVEVADRERYVEALEAAESILEYDLTRVDEGSFYVYACQETREADRLLREAFAALSLIVVPPIVFDAEAAMDLTIVGAGEDLQTLVENVPDEIDVTVHEIGEYDRRHPSIAGSLTDRQLEAVATAVDCGYYEVPRAGSLEDVADGLGCAPSTASDHLQKAESAVMGRLVNRRAGVR